MQPDVEAGLGRFVPAHLVLIDCKQASLDVLLIQQAGELFQAHGEFLTAVVPYFLLELGSVVQSNLVGVLDGLNSVERRLNLGSALGLRPGQSEEQAGNQANLFNH